ncbi:MAG: VanZ family protein [Verrucomicrobiota bacterium]
MNPKVKKYIPLILYALFLLGLSSVPAKKLPQAPQWISDKMVHFALYTGAGIAFYPPFSAPLQSWAATLVMGALDENYQRLTPGRTCDLHDWFADALGGTLGTTLTLLYAKRRHS